MFSWLAQFFTCRNLKKLSHDLKNCFGSMNTNMGWHEYWHAHESAPARLIVHALARATILGSLCMIVDQKCT